MWKSIAGWVSVQVRTERNRLTAAGGLPLSELLPASYVEGVLREEHVEWRDCVYSPLVTLWTFLSQTLCVDHSCRQAVAQLRAFLTADGQRPCAAETGPYCKARQRLPENVCAHGPRCGICAASAGRRPRAVERPSREVGRWHHGEHARHVRQSGRVSAVAFAAAGIGISHRAGGGAIVVGQRRRAGLGAGSLRRQEYGRNGPVPPVVAEPVSRRRGGGRSVLCLLLGPGLAGHVRRGQRVPTASSASERALAQCAGWARATGCCGCPNRNGRRGWIVPVISGFRTNCWCAKCRSTCGCAAGACAS